MRQEKRRPLALETVLLATLLAWASPREACAAPGDDFTVPDMSAFLSASGGQTQDGALVARELYVDQDGIDVLKEPTVPKDQADVFRLVLTQLRRGEQVKVIGETRDGAWYQVEVNRREWDSEADGFKNTRGWVRRHDQLPRPAQSVAAAPGQSPAPTPVPVPAQDQVPEPIPVPSQSATPIPIPVPAQRENPPEIFILAPPRSTPENPALPPKPVDLKPSACRDAFVSALKGFLKPPTPYVWGGTSHRGVDCSGLVVASMLESNCVRTLPPRTAADQQRAAIPLAGPDQLNKGDLIFFGSPVHHVVIYIGDDTTIEAPHTGAFVTTKELRQRISVREKVRFGSLLPKLER